MQPAAADPELEAVASELRRQDPDGGRTARVLRNTLDQLYDGQHTGRYRWDQLHKTEKTHCGTLVEINLHREFKFADGALLDYRIANFEVDCKYSQTLGGWMIPPEAHGQLCLVLWADDATSHWSKGLVRATPERLNGGKNRDGKTTLNAAGKGAIHWLFQAAPLPENILLHLDRDTVERIMAIDSGQKRVNEIFRVAAGKIVGRGVVATLAQQEDYMKRVRGNGGSRSALRSEGVIILGQYSSHGAIARALNLPPPGPGDFLSVKVTPAEAPGPGAVFIDDRYWRVATDEDQIVTGPLLPKTSKKTGATGHF